MTKEELIGFIENLQLDEELEGLLIELVEGAEEVNDLLLDTIADILEMQAQFYENAADVFMDEAEEYDTLNEQLEELDKEEAIGELKVRQEEQEELLAGMEKIVNDFRQNHPEAAAPESPEVQQVKDQLKEHIDATTAPAAPSADQAQGIPPTPVQTAGQSGAPVQPTDANVKTDQKPPFKLW